MPSINQASSQYNNTKNGRELRSREVVRFSSKLSSFSLLPPLSVSLLPCHHHQLTFTVDAIHAPVLLISLLHLVVQALKESSLVRLVID
jgi:hypothetical protein